MNSGNYKKRNYGRVLLVFSFLLHDSLANGAKSLCYIFCHVLFCYGRNNEIRGPVGTFEMYLRRTLCFKFLGAFADHLGKRLLACPPVRLSM
jgi:hypothetical protein